MDMSGVWLTQDPDENIHLGLVSTHRRREGGGRGPGAKGTTGRGKRSELHRGIEYLGDREQ